MDDPFDLNRFVQAQKSTCDRALGELARGRKMSHWMWFVFPQIKGLGHTWTSHHYGIGSRTEAAAYAVHDVLGPRLRECTLAVLTHPDRSANAIFGSPDDMKFRSSMTLFQRCAPDPTLFRRALDTFYSGQPDPLTLDLLGDTRHVPDE